MYYFLCKAAAFEDGIVCKYFHVCSEAQNIKTFQYKKKEFNRNSFINPRKGGNRGSCVTALHNISIRRMPSIQRLHYSFNQNARLMCGNVNTLWNKQKISWLDISRTIKLQKWENFGLMSGWLTSLFVPSCSATQWRLCFMAVIWNNKWQMIW